MFIAGFWCVYKGAICLSANIVFLQYEIISHLHNDHGYVVNSVGNSRHFKKSKSLFCK